MLLLPRCRLSPPRFPEPGCLSISFPLVVVISARFSPSLFFLFLNVVMSTLITFPECPGPSYSTGASSYLLIPGASQLPARGVDIWNGDPLPTARLCEVDRIFQTPGISYRNPIQYEHSTDRRRKMPGAITKQSQDLSSDRGIVLVFSMPESSPTLFSSS